MSLIVKKSALVELVKKLSLENRSYHSANMAEVPAKDEDTPIVPSEEMSIQLSSEKPPVEDPDYFPTTISDLGSAAQAVSDEVPQDQINFFYRGLHKLLDLAHDKASDRSKVQKEISETLHRLIQESEDIDLDSTVDDEEEISDDDLPKEMGREYYVSMAVDQIVKKIIDNKIHLVELPGAYVLDMETGERRQQTVTANKDQITYVMNRALDYDVVKAEVDKAVSELKINFAILVSMVREEVLGYLANRSEVMTPELAAEMKSNILADKLWKEASASEEDEEKPGTEEIVGRLRAATDRELEEINQSAQNGIYEFSLPDLGSFSISVDEFTPYMNDAIDDVISRNVSGKDPMFADDEAEEEEDSDEDVISKEEVQQIRKKLRDETLASEFEPGKLNLSQESIRAITEKISEEMGTSVGNVRNILYDDLIASGMDNEVMRRIFGLRRMPRGRKSISLLYDPLKIQAEEKIVEKLYEIFRHALSLYIDDRPDDDPLSGLRDRFLGNNGLFQPGIEGYRRLQAVVGGPDMMSQDVDIDSTIFRDTRNAYEISQAFFDKIAKDYIAPEDIKAKGGIKRMMKDYEDTGVFSSLDRREGFDEFIAKKMKLYDSFMKDTERAKKLLTDIIHQSLSAAPKRRDRYIDQIKKERAARS